MINEKNVSLNKVSARPRGELNGKGNYLHVKIMICTVKKCFYLTNISILMLKSTYML